MQIAAVFLYMIFLLGVGVFSYHKQRSAQDFMLGGRALNFWFTALAAHASDMGGWLFLAYPALIFTGGLFKSWVAVGLLLFMFLNWQFVATRIRKQTEKFGSLTFSSFFESRVKDESGKIRIFTSLIACAFYTIYVAAGLVGLGVLLESLFGVSYVYGVLIGIFIAVPYVLFGGFTTLAWIDFFQGLFLLGVILFVPFFTLSHVGSWSGLSDALARVGLWEGKWYEALFLVFGWGIGYFGQPHIVTKFMGIKNAEELHKSKWIGMSWMVFALGAATMIGIVGIALFPNGLANPETLFIANVKSLFHPFAIGLILCAVLASTINATSSQILVLASSATEDLYKMLFHKKATQKELIRVSRLAVIFSTLISFAIAVTSNSSIYNLVHYAWSGLGSSFGPLILFSLYWKKLNRYGAWAGVLAGGIMSAIWIFFQDLLPIYIPALVPGFIVSSLAIYVVSTYQKNG